MQPDPQLAVINCPVYECSLVVAKGTVAIALFAGLAATATQVWWWP